MRPQRGKQKLFDAARKLFESQGYFATTVEQVTLEAGVSKGLVYNYFKSKEDLLVGLIDESTQRMAAMAEPFVPTNSLGDSLALFIDNYFSYLKLEKDFLRLQLTLLLMPELKDVLNKSQKQRAKLLLNSVAEWFRQAKLTEPEIKARLFLALLDGVALHYLAIYDRYPLLSMKSQVLQSAKDLCHPSKIGETS